MSDEHLTKVDIGILLNILEGEDQDIKYIRPFQTALKELKAARLVVEAANLIEPHHNVHIPSYNFLDAMLKKYDEVVK